MTRVRPGLIVLAVAILAGAGLWLWSRLQKPQVLVGRSSARAAPSAVPVTESALVLFAPSGQAHWERELLATYGFPSPTRVADAALSTAVSQPGLRWVVANAELDAATRAILRAAVQRGAFVVELGPKSAVCGLTALPDAAGATPTPYRVAGSGLDGVRWPVAVATVPACQASDCGTLSVLAHVSGGEDVAAQRPLITRELLGKGACTRWLGDLRAATQRLRQGDPTRAAARPSTASVFKPGELFADDLAAQDYDIPSADRLGFALAAQITAAPGPDLLLSPLPAVSDGLVILTADQDFVPGPGVLAQSAELGSAGLTVTLTAADIGAKPDVVFRQSDPSLMTADLVAELAERGHDVGIHPNLVGLVPARYAEVLGQHVAAFRRAYGESPRIVRNHHLVWWGYTDMARLQAAAGLAFNLDFVTAATSAGYHPGFMTGSGLPMHFLDERGRALAIYQQATQIDDYVFTPGQAPSRNDALATLIAATKRLFAIGQREHVPITVLHHPAWWYETAGAWQEAILQEAAQRGMAVWSAGRFLAFVEEVRATRITRTHAGFDVLTAATGAALLVEGAKHWTVNGQAVATTRTRTLAGASYRELPLSVGLTHVRGQ